MSSVIDLGHNKIDNGNKVNSKPPICNAFVCIIPNANLAIPQ